MQQLQLLDSRNDMIWYDMIWYDMIWYDIIKFDFTPPLSLPYYDLRISDFLLNL